MIQWLTLDDLSFQLRLSPRRSTVGITVERDGTLVLMGPSDASVPDLRSLVDAKREWIYTKLDEKRVHLARMPQPKEYITGEEFWFLGRTYRLGLIRPEKGQRPLRLSRGQFLLHEDRANLGRGLFLEWYKDHLLPRLTNLSCDYARRLGLEYGGVRIQSLGHRWGSCGRTGRLNFHWRTATLPQHAIEYIVAHEVAHLAQDGHGAYFWHLVGRLVPDYSMRKKWLVREGVRYDL